MEWIASCWKLVLCLAVLILAIAVLIHVIVKNRYELKIGNKKVEVTPSKETPTKTKR